MTRSCGSSEGNMTLHRCGGLKIYHYYSREFQHDDWRIVLLLQKFVRGLFRAVQKVYPFSLSPAVFADRKQCHPQPVECSGPSLYALKFSGFVCFNRNGITGSYRCAALCRNTAGTDSCTFQSPCTSSSRTNDLQTLRRLDIAADLLLDICLSRIKFVRRKYSHGHSAQPQRRQIQ